MCSVAGLETRKEKSTSNSRARRTRSRGSEKGRRPSRAMLPARPARRSASPDRTPERRGGRRQAAYRPIAIGLVGAGKFGAMFCAQIRLTDGMHLLGVADLDVARARRQLQEAGWNPDAIAAPSLEAADTTGFLHVTDDADALLTF